MCVAHCNVTALRNQVVTLNALLPRVEKKYLITYDKNPSLVTGYSYPVSRFGRMLALI